MAIQRIGIVGAGPAGLAALKAILDTPQYKAGLWIPTAFEARENVGGVWLPSPSQSGPGNTTPPPATPLYDSLTTNLPHPIMAFTSFPFPASTPLFPKAEAVQTYLESYTSYFDLHEYIHLNARVTNVDWDQNQSKWIVETSDPHSQISRWSFNLLLVCNGHHNVPRYPTIPGLDTWLVEGHASHSMFYRNPSSVPSSSNDLKNQTIVVIGGGPSGSDITAELVPLAGRVLHSFSVNSAAARAASSSSSSSTPPPDVETLPDPIPSKEATGAIPKPRVSRFFDGGTIHFEDGSEERNVDYCILATGYEVDFPFFASSNSASSISTTEPDPNFSIARTLVPYIPLNTIRLPKADLTNTSWGVFPLARHLFGIPGCGFSSSSSTEGRGKDKDDIDSRSTQLPPPTSLAFLGLPVRVVPLPLVEVQARAALTAFAINSRPRRAAESSSDSSIDWSHEESKIMDRWRELKDKYDSLNGPSLESDSIKTPTPDHQKIRAFISKEWHRFSEEARQFDYRDELDDLTFSLLSSFPSLSSTSTQTRVKLWEKHFYAHKLTLRKAWRELEARGLAEEWLQGVGSGELPPPSEGGEPKRPGKTKEERVEAEWVALMERVLEFGKSL